MAPRLQIVLLQRGAPVNGANLGSMGFKLSTKLINKLMTLLTTTHGAYCCGLNICYTQ
jgi:hypothetical protein